MLNSKDLNNDVTSSYVNIRMIDEVKNVIPLAVTLLVGSFKVVMEEPRNASLLNKLRAWRRRDYYMGLSIWYAIIEDLLFYFDDLVKIFVSEYPID
jgi:hypothetical protein